MVLERMIPYPLSRKIGVKSVVWEFGDLMGKRRCLGWR